MTSVVASMAELVRVDKLRLHPQLIVVALLLGFEAPVGDDNRENTINVVPLVAQSGAASGNFLRDSLESLFLERVVQLQERSGMVHKHARVVMLAEIILHLDKKVAILTGDTAHIHHDTCSVESWIQLSFNELYGGDGLMVFPQGHLHDSIEEPFGKAGLREELAEHEVDTWVNDFERRGGGIRISAKLAKMEGNTKTCWKLPDDCIFYQMRLNQITSFVVRRKVRSELFSVIYIL